MSMDERANLKEWIEAQFTNTFNMYRIFEKENNEFKVLLFNVLI